MRLLALLLAGCGAAVEPPPPAETDECSPFALTIDIAPSSATTASWVEVTCTGAWDRGPEDTDVSFCLDDLECVGRNVEATPR